MSAARLRLPDFGLEARLSSAGEPTCGQAQLEAIRRQAFSEGEAHGRAAAGVAAAAVHDEHAQALRRLAHEAAAIRAEADALVQEALLRMEGILAAALASAMRHAADSRFADDLRREVREALAAVRLPEIELKAASATLSLLRDADPPLSPAVRLTVSGDVPDGEVRLAWSGGGAAVQPSRPVRDAQSALASILPGPPSTAAAADLSTGTVHKELQA